MKDIRRDVEKKREKNEMDDEEKRKLDDELEDVMEWINENEENVR